MAGSGPVTRIPIISDTIGRHGGRSWVRVRVRVQTHNVNNLFRLLLLLFGDGGGLPVQDPENYLDHPKGEP